MKRRLDPVAVRDAVEAFVLSRLLVFGVAAYAMLTLDPRDPAVSGYDPPAGAEPGFTGAFDGWPLEGVWEALFLPLAQWDAGWYIAIADEGYEASTGEPPVPQSRAAFFPLYPLLVRLVGFGGSEAFLIVAGYVVSAAALLAALYLLHRLVTIELGREAARASVLILAFFPTAFFLSAPYAESLFLALAIGTFLAARTDRWALAGLLAGLATATRSAGLALIPALLFMYLSDRRAEGATRARIRPDVLWIALGLAGVVAFTVYLESSVGDGFRWVSAQEGWKRETGVLSATWKGAESAVEAVGDLASGDRPRGYAPGGNDPFRLAAHNLALFGLLLASLAAFVGVARRLPLAYTVFAGLTMVLALSAPETDEPLYGYSRYVLSSFPLFMWAGAACARPPWTTRAVAACAVGLGLLTAQFATVQWVA